MEKRGTVGCHLHNSGKRDYSTTGLFEDKVELVPGPVGGEEESVRSNVEKKSINSDECSFSGWMLKSPRTTSGVPSSGAS